MTEKNLMRNLNNEEIGVALDSWGDSFKLLQFQKSLQSLQYLTELNMQFWHGNNKLLFWHEDHNLDALRYGLTSEMQPPKRLPLWRRFVNWLKGKVIKCI